MKTIPSLQTIQDAAVVLRDVARQTPVLPFGRHDGNLFIKAENLQNTGSFKIRGAYNKLSSLTAEEASKGVIACSAGATSAAAYMFDRIDTGLRTVAVVSGGNIDVCALEGIISREMTRRENDSAPNLQ